MAAFNMPPGCLGASDIDHAAALGYREAQCPTCKQAEGDCDCCTSCAAGPNEPCAVDCECRSCQCADVNAHLGARESA
jgi:hypothetical protein